jgi:hypothetical protein
MTEGIDGMAGGNAEERTLRGYERFQESLANDPARRAMESLFTDGRTRLAQNEINDLADFGFSPVEIARIEQDRRKPVVPWDAFKAAPEFATLSRVEQSQKGYQFLRDLWMAAPAAKREDPTWLAEYDQFSQAFERTEIRNLQREDWQISEHVRAAWDRMGQQRKFRRIDRLEDERLELESMLESGQFTVRKRQGREDRELELVSRIQEIKAEQMDLAQTTTRLMDKLAEADVNKGYSLFQQTGKFSEFAKYADRQDWWGMFVGMSIDSAFGAIETITGAAAGAGTGAAVGGLPGAVIGGAVGVGVSAYDVEFSHRFATEFFQHMDERHPGWAESDDRDDLLLEAVANRALMSRIRDRASSGAGAVASTEAITSLATAGFAYGVFRAAGSSRRRFAHGASLVGNQIGSAAGGSLGEFRAMLAEGRDPFTGQAFAEITLEGLLEFGSAPIETIAVANTIRSEASLARKERIRIDSEKAQRVSGVTLEILMDSGVPQEQAAAVLAEPDLAKRFDLMAEALQAASAASVETGTAKIVDGPTPGNSYTVQFPDGTSETFPDADQAQQAAYRWEEETDQSRLGEIRREKQIAQETREMGEEWQKRREGRGEAEVRFKDTYTTLQDRIDERVEAGMNRDDAAAEAVAQMRQEFVDELVRRGMSTASIKRLSG